MFTLVVLWRGITRNDRGSPGCSCRRGVTRPHSCSLARYGRQTKSVVLCISEKKIAPPSEPQGLTRELRPPHPLLIPSLRRTHGSETSKEPWVQLQWTSGLIKVQPMHPGLSNSFHMAGTPPTTSMAHGIMVGHTTAETRSNLNVLPLRESPCILPTTPPNV